MRRDVATTDRPRGGAVLDLFLAAAVLAVWAATLRNGFVSYDDELYVVRNPQVLSGLTPSAIAWAFTTGYAANWHPVTWLSHMLDVSLFGMNPAGHHATSVLLHLANTLLLYRLLLRMTGARARSAVVAALFALHPLRVESVAWVAERKDLLSTLFGLLSLSTYVRYVRKKKRSAYTASLILFALSLASKPMLVTLPFLLFLLDGWPLERRTRLRTLVVEKLPYLALSLASSVVTYLVQRRGEAMAALTLPLVVRLDNAVLSYVRYLGKLLYPVHLAVLYPHSAVTHGWPTMAAAALLLGTSAGCLLFARRLPYLRVGWLWYVGTLVPVIGLVQVGWQSMADRYTYFPTIGLGLSLVWGVADLTRAWVQRRFGLASASAVVLVALSALTLRQIRMWRDSITLYENALSVTGSNETVEINLGNELARQGRLEEARFHFERAVRVFPGSFDAYYARGVVDDMSGRPAEAVRNLEEALRLKPDFAEANARLGTVLISQGRWKEAVERLERALRYKPNSPETLYALGAALEGAGRESEAIERYRGALQLKPDYAQAHSNLGLLLLSQGKAADALAHLERTADLDASSPQARSDLATCLSAIGRHEAASRELQEALRLSPRSPAFLSRLALELAWAADGDLARAEEAIRQARTACEWTEWKDPSLLDTLARVQANAGRFDDALETGGRALTLARQMKATELAAKLEGRLLSYQQKRAVALTQER